MQPISHCKQPHEERRTRLTLSTEFNVFHIIRNILFRMSRPQIGVKYWPRETLPPFRLLVSLFFCSWCCCHRCTRLSWEVVYTRWLNHWAASLLCDPRKKNRRWYAHCSELRILGRLIADWYNDKRALWLRPIRSRTREITVWGWTLMNFNWFVFSRLGEHTVVAALSTATWIEFMIWTWLQRYFFLRSIISMQF